MKMLWTQFILLLVVIMACFCTLVRLEPMLDKSTLSANLRGKVWIVSHGGVGSEYFRSLLGSHSVFELSMTKVGEGKKKRPFRGVAAHYPSPPVGGPLLCIYIYGDVYSSILSQLRRHPDNPAKLHNDESYPLYSELGALLDAFEEGGEEPFGIERQYRYFSGSEVSYPVVMLRSDAVQHEWVLRQLDELIRNTTGVSTTLASSYKWASRASKMANVEESLRARFVEKYGYLDAMFKSNAPMTVRFPCSAHHSEQHIKLRPEGQRSKFMKIAHKWTDTSWARFMHGPRARIKHIIEIEEFHVVNYRLDLNATILAWKKSDTNPMVFPGPEVPVPPLLHNNFFGMEDPRAFTWLGKPYVVCNGAMENWRTRSTFIIDLREQRVTKLWISHKGHDTKNQEEICFSGKQPAIGNCIEKNWTPYVHKDKVMIMYKMGTTTPTILELVDAMTGECHIVVDHPMAISLHTRKHAGGSSFIPWSYPYHVSVAHITHMESSGVIVWRAVPMLYNAETHVSIFAPSITFPVPQTKLATQRFRFNKDVQYPYHVALTAEGTITLAVEHNDRYPTWYKLSVLDFSRLLPCIKDVSK